jgi:CheY-like chemotaxis protein
MKSPLPDLPPNIRRVPGLTLTPAETSLLARAFAGSEEIFIERDFRSGYSGALVLLVSPGAGQAQMVVKLGLPADLQREYAAYRRYVEPASPQNTARVQGEPLLSEDRHLALLSYTFAGGDPRLPTNSLHTYYTKQGGQAAAQVLDRVFRIYGRQWWGINRPQKFVVSEQYDRLLHIHLKIDAQAPIEGQPHNLIAGQVSATQLLEPPPGRPVCLQGFRVAEIRPDQRQITLMADPPSGEASAPLRVRLEKADTTAYNLGQLVEALTGVVTATRYTLLREAIRAALPTFNPDAPYFNLSGRAYGNPLPNLSSLLNRAQEARFSIIHGDLNLENILVDETTGFAWLIDFAETRPGPTLFDLQRLEGQIITRLLPAIVAQLGLGPEVMLSLYDSLHGDPPRLTAPHTTLQEIYTLLVNLRRLARQYLMDDRDWDEYYLGLVITLLGTLKFRGLESPAPGLALLGALAAYNLIRTPLPVWPKRLDEWDLTGYRVLVVEDDPIWQDILRESLTETGCLVEIAGAFNEARNKLQSQRFNLITIDAHLGQQLQAQEGILLLNYIRNHFGPAAPVIIISGEINRRDVIKAFKQFSVTNVLLKEDFEYDKFREAVRDALLASTL